MGTYYTTDTQDLTAYEFLKRELDRPGHKIIDHSVHGRTAYLACQTSSGEVYGLVCMLHKNSDGWGYNPVEESMGPYEVECPLRILDKLSPTDSEYALRWRNDCREHASLKRKRSSMGVGSVIRFPSPLRFSDGSTCQEFKVELAMTRGKRSKAYRGENGRLYKITNIHKKDFEVVR